MAICLFWTSIFSSDTTPHASQAFSFMEAQGKVIEPIGANATGRVQLQGVSWLARCADTLLHPLPVDTPVQVIERVGLVLLIRPLAMPVTPVIEPSSARHIRLSIRQKCVA